MQCEGNRLVLVATKGDVISSHPVFARYKPVPFITLPTFMDYMTYSSCFSEPREKWQVVRTLPVGLFPESCKSSNIALERSELGYARELMQYEGNRSVSHEKRMG